MASKKGCAAGTVDNNARQCIPSGQRKQQSTNNRGKGDDSNRQWRCGRRGMDSSPGDSTTAATTRTMTSTMHVFVGGWHKHNTTINKWWGRIWRWQRRARRTDAEGKGHSNDNGRRMSAYAAIIDKGWQQCSGPLSVVENSWSWRCLRQIQHNNQPQRWWRAECGRTRIDVGRQQQRQQRRQLKAKWAARNWCCHWRMRPSNEIRHVERRLCAKSLTCKSRMPSQASLPWTSFEPTDGQSSSPGSMVQVAQ